MVNDQSNLFREVSAETIRSIFIHALHETIIWEASLLDGGMFHTTYVVEYGTSHKKSVLRLGSVTRHLLMGFEENPMDAEIFAYLVCREIRIPCSHVLACDTSRLCF